MSSTTYQLPEDLGAADPGGMLATVLDTPAQWEQAAALAAELPPGAVPDGPRGVIVVGMGGSGISGDVAAALADGRGRAPVTVVKGYRLPAWVGPGTLVIAVSHSGDTEETLAAAEQAAADGADLLVVTSGGRLQELARQVGCPAVTVPRGLPPRASVAWLTTPVLVALERAGVLPAIEHDLGELGEHLTGLRDRWRPGTGADGDGPLELAGRLVGATPWFLAARGPASVVAYRAACQLNENAGRIAHVSQLPEADHNAVVAWAGDDPVPGRLVLVEVREADEAVRVSRRFTATRDIASGCFDAVVTQRLDGPTPLARIAAGFLFVDLTSVALALLTGVDPTPVAPIDRLKQRLAQPAAASTGPGGPGS